MEKWLRLVTRDIVIIDTMALIVVAIGTAEAFFTGLWAACPASRASRKFRESLVCYGRWLVASLTFQLAAAQERMSKRPFATGETSTARDPIRTSALLLWTTRALPSVL